MNKSSKTTLDKKNKLIFESKSRKLTLDEKNDLISELENIKDES